MAVTMSTMNGAPRELNQGGTSTSEVAFTTDGTTVVLLPLPAAGQLSGSPGAGSAAFRVTAWGRVTGGTTINYTAQLQYGTSATPGSNTDIEASTARAVNSESGTWMIQTDLTWDVTSSKIQGRGWSMVNTLVDAVATIDNEITSSDPDADGTLGFVVTGTFSSGHASNAAYLDGFVLERIGG